MASGNTFLSLALDGTKELLTAISAFTGNANEIVATDSNGLVSADLLPPDVETWSWAVARNANNVTNQALRKQNGTPTNLSPYVAPFDCVIYAGTANSQATTPDATTWDAVIQINGGANIILAAVPATGDQVEFTASQNLNAGDLVAIGMANQSAVVNRPSIELHLRGR